jgi:hypothetical protein
MFPTRKPMLTLNVYGQAVRTTADHSFSVAGLQGVRQAHQALATASGGPTDHAATRNALAAVLELLTGLPFVKQRPSGLSCTAIC